MIRRMLRAPTLRTKLLLLLLPAMAAIAAAELWLMRQDAVAAANSAYDRSLIGAIKAIDANISTESGGLSVELPYRQFEFFELTASGAVYFRVATSDGMVELGSPDLPPPPRPPRPGVPVFYDAEYFGESLRLGAYTRELADAQRSVEIQVAESTASRRSFSSAFVQRAALRDIGMLVLMGATLMLLVWLALRPLARLATEVRSRGPSDLTPLEARGLPADIQPLVDAVNQQLARTQALMQRQRRFLDDASHQLRTPLATLRTQVDYALGESDPAQMTATLQAVSAQIDGVTRSANQLLALARSEAAELDWQRFDLGALLRELGLALLPLARAKQLDFGIEVAQEPCLAEGDAGLLREALANLAHNAVRHAPQRGVVTLSAAAGPDGCELAVVDDGPGLPAEVAARAGERFVKGRASAGAGLGLAISSAIIERHGGRLRLEPRRDGPGLRALLRWPRRAGAEGAGP